MFYELQYSIFGSNPFILEINAIYCSEWEEVFLKAFWQDLNGKSKILPRNSSSYKIDG